jgi:pimeloyl-ACP methyl ester carboxylesterase
VQVPAELPDEAVVQLIYLHGFASSPSSGKARYFADRLAERGRALIRPDLNLPDFATLTVTRMLDQVDRAIDAREPGPVALIGSSLGGLVALLAAARRARRLDSRHPVERLVLMAPAFDFGAPREAGWDVDVAEWRRTDRLEVFHHAYGRTVPVHYALHEDAQQYDAYGVDLAVPTLIFQGTRDTVCSLRGAERFAALRPHVTLRLLDDDHQLQGHLEVMWRVMAPFLGVTP